MSLSLSLSADPERLQKSALSSLACLFLSTDEVDGTHARTHTN